MRTDNNAKLWFTAHDDSLLDVRSFAVREAVSELFAVSVVAVTDNDFDLDSIVGKGAALTLHRGSDVQTWAGVCGAIAHTGTTPDGLSSYSVSIAPDLWRTTLRTNSRVFQHASIPDIVLQVLEEWGISAEARHFSPGDRSAYPLHEYRVQYGETDFAFLSRLLEEVGISYYFAHAKSSGAGKAIVKLVLDAAPQSNHARSASLPFSSSHGNEARGADFAADVGIAQKMALGTVTMRDFDFRLAPDTQLYKKGTAGKGAEPSYEQYEYAPGAFVVEKPGSEEPVADARGVRKYDATEAQAVVTRALDALRSGRRVVTFATNALDVCPGIKLTIGRLTGPAASPDGLLVVESRIEGKHDDGDWLIHCRAVPADVPHRPARRTPRPRVAGVQSALVVGPPGQEIYCDEFGRIRVQFHWDRDHKYGAAAAGKNLEDMSSCWVRVAHQWAGAGYGVISVPRVGHEVLVDFFEGDPDRPVVVGHVYNKTLPVPYKLPDHATRSGIRTDSSPGSGGYNELMFEDRKGEELIRIQAERNVDKVVKGDENASIGAQRTTLIGKSDALDVGEEHVVTVGKDNGVRITKDHKIVITAGGASIVIVDDQIFLNAMSNIHIHAGGELLLSSQGDTHIDGANVYINCASPGVPHVDPFGEARPPKGGGTSGPGKKPQGAPPPGPKPPPIDDVTVPEQKTFGDA